MKNIIGILREGIDKLGEKRTAITPANANQIINWGFKLLIEPAVDPENGEIKRAFKDEDYVKAGAVIKNNLSEANVMFGLKEININKILPDKTYLFFSHTHKGQIKNRYMLKKLVENKNTLIDYELITDNNNRRLITAFTFIAGSAGMVDTFWALGEKLKLKGIESPFKNITQSINAKNLAHIKDLLVKAGEKIKVEGTPETLPPIICCILGRGKTSIGAQQILDMLPCEQITFDKLSSVCADDSRKKIYKLVLKVYDMFRLKEKYKKKYPGNKDIDKVRHYLKNPNMYESNMERILPYVTVLMNCIVWSNEYPRLLTNDLIKKIYSENQTLLVIGDVTCDPNGSIEFSKETWIDNPVYTYYPINETIKNGFESDGIIVMAVTNLPCEFSTDASEKFSNELLPFLKGIISADYNDRLSASGLPDSIKNAVIMWRGIFTEKYKYMEEYIS